MHVNAYVCVSAFTRTRAYQWFTILGSKPSSYANTRAYMYPPYNYNARTHFAVSAESDSSHSCTKVLLYLRCRSVLLLPTATQACELDQTQHGCRIDNGACTCAYGCRSDFRYATRKECQDALKVIAVRRSTPHQFLIFFPVVWTAQGRSSDICGRAPCLNNGRCIQISKMPNYTCQCDGTGYWGSRCQRECPSSAQALVSGASYPHECIVI